MQITSRYVLQDLQRQTKQDFSGSDTSLGTFLPFTENIAVYMLAEGL